MRKRLTDNFAQIFDRNFDAQTNKFDKSRFYDDRDNFLEYHESAIRHNHMEPNDLCPLFEERPRIGEYNEMLGAQACATADIVLRRNNINWRPDWIDDWSCSPEQPYWLIPPMDAEFAEIILDNVPPECAKRYIWAEERHFTYR